MGDFQSVQLTVTGCQFCCQRNKEKIYFQGRAAHSNELFRQKEWKILWDLKVSSKIKVFRPLQVFSREEIRHSSECKICGVDEDTWEHALLRCTMSRCVWALMDEGVTDYYHH